MAKGNKALRIAELLLWLVCASILLPKAYDRLLLYLEGPGASPGALPDRVSAPQRLGQLTVGMEEGGVALRLGEPAASHYGKSRWTDADRHFGNLVDDIPHAEYDPALAHAAREVAQVYANTMQLPEHGAFMFLLNAAGAADWGVKQALMLTTRTGDAPVRQRLMDLLGEEQASKRPARVGIGEVIQLGVPPRRSLAVLISKSDLYMDPVPRELFAGTRVTLKGLLPRGATELRALRLGPDGLMTTLDAEVVNERFEISVPAGIHRGTVWVELIATMEHGPTPLAQMGFAVGVPLATEWTGISHGQEENLENHTDAEQYAYQLLQRDREIHGVPSLTRDTDLDKVARNHCVEMEANRFFGHHSPLTGGIRDRINDAGLDFRSVGENLARNTTIGSAQEGLMFSIGHRKNCLSDNFSHVGIGVSLKEEDGRRVWHLCQVFGQP